MESLRRDKVRQRLMEMGALALMENRLADAEKHYRNAMRMTTERQALSHPDVGECLLKLGDIRIMLNRPEEAVSLYHLSAFVFERNGTQNASLWISINKLFEARQSVREAVTRANVEALALMNAGAALGANDDELKVLPIEKPVAAAEPLKEREPSRLVPALYTGGSLLPVQ